MSLLKWTLAAAGTAIGMRYMSDRHRRRLAEGGSRDAQTDRDDGRSNQTPWSAAQGSDDAVGGLGSNLGTGVGTGLGTGASMGPGAGIGSSIGTGIGTGISGSGASRFGHDDLLAPDSDDPAPGSSSNRF